MIEANFKRKKSPNIRTQNFQVLLEMKDLKILRQGKMVIIKNWEEMPKSCRCKKNSYKSLSVTA